MVCRANGGPPDRSFVYLSRPRGECELWSVFELHIMTCNPLHVSIDLDCWTLTQPADQFLNSFVLCICWSRTGLRVALLASNRGVKTKSTCSRTASSPAFWWDDAISMLSTSWPLLMFHRKLKILIVQVVNCSTFHPRSFQQHKLALSQPKTSFQLNSHHISQNSTRDHKNHSRRSTNKSEFFGPQGTPQYCFEFRPVDSCQTCQKFHFCLSNASPLTASMCPNHSRKLPRQLEISFR